LGTLHINLKQLKARDSFVGAAGELKKTGPRIQYNLLSGTFMEPKLRKKTESEKTVILNQARNRTRNTLKRLFPNANINHTQMNKNIILPENIRTSPHLIQEFNRMFHRKNMEQPNAKKVKVNPRKTVSKKVGK